MLRVQNATFAQAKPTSFCYHTQIYGKIMKGAMHRMQGGHEFPRLALHMQHS
jgi:hypothetical protein